MATERQDPLGALDPPTPQHPSSPGITIQFNPDAHLENPDPAVKFVDKKEVNGTGGSDVSVDAQELLVSQSILHGLNAISKTTQPTNTMTADSGAHKQDADPLPDRHTQITRPKQLPVKKTGQLEPDEIASEVLVKTETDKNGSTYSREMSPMAACPDPTFVGTERSFITGLKHRIQGKQELLKGFTGRIEDFIMDKGIIEAKKAPKGTHKSLSTSELRELPQARFQLNSGDNGRSTTPTKQQSTLNGDGMKNIYKHRPASFDLADDYYTVNADDYQDAPTFDFPKSSSMDAIRQSQQQIASRESPIKIKAKLQKLIQPIADRSGSTILQSVVSQNQPSVQNVSMSELLHSSNNTEDECQTTESDQFFDPSNEMDHIAIKKPSPQDSQPLELSSEKSDQPVLAKPTCQRHYSKHYKLIAATGAVLAYLVAPLPTYVAGMVFGAFLASIFIFLYLWWTQPQRVQEMYIIPELESLPLRQVPEMKDIITDNDEFKVWMNELSNYDKDNYHIGSTHSVLVHLEGTRLRLQTPKYNIPRRAFWTESAYNMSTFIKQRHYDLQGAQISLLPENLVKKRLWSKKYPICLVPVAMCDDTPFSIYLFARSCREKEEWFRKFEAAATGCPLPTLGTILTDASPSPIEDFQSKWQDMTSELNTVKMDDTKPETSHEQRLSAYLRYMSRVIPAAKDDRKSSISSLRLPTAIKCEPQIAWFNALATRCFWDFLREDYWIKKIQDKIQNKIGKIHIPWFIDDLTVTGCELGCEVPVIRRASKPYVDERGLWMDVDIAYTGGFCMKLETKCNLMKLTKKPTNLVKVNKDNQTRSPTLDSDEEDSAESSTDEDCEENMECEEERSTQQPTSGTGGKILRIVDKIAQSKYFHKATEYKYIKKAMEGVSNTRLLLVVEVKNIAGPLAINIPPPPSDRLWYGFRESPRLWLSVKPWVGEREVSLSHVTEWIEKKLVQEFQRVFVMPNMDDIPIPIMCDQLPKPASPDSL